jgi:hypothetical protein
MVVVQFIQYDCWDTPNLFVFIAPMSNLCFLSSRYKEENGDYSIYTIWLPRYTKLCVYSTYHLCSTLAFWEVGVRGDGLGGDSPDLKCFLLFTERGDSPDLKWFCCSLGIVIHLISSGFVVHWAWSFTWSQVVIHLISSGFCCSLSPCVHTPTSNPCFLPGIRFTQTRQVEG